MSEEAQGDDEAERILNRVAIDAALDSLSPPERDLIGMVTGYRCPADYEGPWPATLTDTGVYIGLKYKGRPLAEATVRNRRDAIYARWAHKRVRDVARDAARAPAAL